MSIYLNAVGWFFFARFWAFWILCFIASDYCL